MHRLTDSINDKMGVGSLSWHQWRKHWNRSDLLPGHILDFSRSAFNNVVHLYVFRRLKELVKLKARVVLHRFLKADPNL